jgi:hypothetical protein
VAKQRPYVGCTVRHLPDHRAEEAMWHAIKVNPTNRPQAAGLAKIHPLISEELFAQIATPEFLAVMTTKYWGPAGVKLSVSFLDTVSQELSKKILSHMNAWGDYCNAKFSRATRDGDVRIDLSETGQYASYIGTDVKLVPAGEPTMWLSGFSLKTPASEYRRVVRHETGHTLGFPHEHFREQIVSRLDPEKTVAYMEATQGWDAKTVRQQVLTPLSEASIRGTPDADDTSIMCYELPAEITKDGRPIPGGTDINATDKKFAATVYPKRLIA